MRRHYHKNKAQNQSNMKSSTLKAAADDFDINETLLKHQIRQSSHRQICPSASMRPNLSQTPPLLLSVLICNGSEKLRWNGGEKPKVRYYVAVINFKINKWPCLYSRYEGKLSMARHLRRVLIVARYQEMLCRIVKIGDTALKQCSNEKAKLHRKA